jgi:hypothetical protein
MRLCTAEIATGKVERWQGGKWIGLVSARDMRNQRTGSAHRLTVRLNNLSGDDCLNMVLLQGLGKQPDSGVDAVRCNQLSLGSKCYIGWGFVAARGLQD